MDFNLIQPLVKQTDTKIVLLLLDGLGGLPQEGIGLRELEAAYRLNLDGLAEDSVCGLHIPLSAPA